MEGLTSLFASARLPKRIVRSVVCLTVFYGFGDTPGVGHADKYQGLRKVAPGKSSQMEEYSFVTVIGAKRYKVSSNYGELLNLVELLKAQVEDRRIRGAEVFYSRIIQQLRRCFSRAALLWNNNWS
jgi:hypothetical protein